jgi:hypothetical protein
VNCDVVAATSKSLRCSYNSDKTLVQRNDDWSNLSNFKYRSEQFWHDTVHGAAPVTLWRHRTSAEEWSTIDRRAIERIRQTLADWLPVELISTALSGNSAQALRLEPGN